MYIESLRRSRSDSLHDGTDALAQADAHGGQPQASVPGLHQVQQGGEDARARTSQRMSQGDGTTVQVDLVIQLLQQVQFLQAGSYNFV